MAALLYLATSLGLIVVWRRFVQPVSRAATVALLLMPLLFTGRALLTGRVYAPIDLPFNAPPLSDYTRDYGATLYNPTLSDNYAQFIPWQHVFREMAGKGEWPPLWNPYFLCGSILATNMQSQPYDPVHLVGLLLPHTQALTYDATFTFFLALLFTFAFARALGLGEIASLVAAAGYAFCAMLVHFLGVPLGRTWSYLGLVLFAVRWLVRGTDGTHETYRTDETHGAAILLTIAFVLAIVAGHPESLMQVVTTGAVYGVAELLVARRRARPVVLAVAAGVIALLLTAIALLPFQEVAPDTLEYKIRQDFYQGKPLPYPPEVLPRRVGMSLFPWFWGQPERGNHLPGIDPTNFRVGSIVLGLACAALVVSRRKVTLLFAAIAVGSLWIGLNAWPLAQLVHALPLYDIAINERFILSGVFALAVLAAIAVDALGSQPRWKVWLPLLTVGVLLTIGTVYFRPRQLAVGVEPSLMTMLALAELVPLAILILLLALRTPARIVLPALLVLVLLQRTVEDGRIYPALPERMFYPSVPILRHMQADHSEPFRMAGLHYTFIPDSSGLYGLEDARGFEAMTLFRMTETFPFWSRHQTASFNIIYDKSRPFLSFLNVKYLIAKHDEQPDEQWKLVREDRGTRLFENTRVLPRAWVPPNIRYEQLPVAVLYSMQQASGFAEKAWIEAPEYPPHDIANGPGTLTYRRTGSGYDIDARMDGDGWVVVSETHWPGWRAYVDGKRVQARYANHAFLGVYVPKGTHKVRLVYQPEGYTRGRNITLVTVVALVVGWFFMNRRNGTDKTSGTHHP
jgi:hypothetical protein